MALPPYVYNRCTVYADGQGGWVVVVQRTAEELAAAAVEIAKAARSVVERLPLPIAALELVEEEGASRYTPPENTIAPFIVVKPVPVLDMSRKHRPWLHPA